MREIPIGKKIRGERKRDSESRRRIVAD